MNDINGLDHYTDQLFRKRLLNAVESNPEHLWDEIATALNQEQKKNRIFTFGWIFKFLIGLLVLSLGALGLYYYINKDNSNSDQNKKESFKEASFSQGSTFNVSEDKRFNSLNNKAVDHFDTEATKLNLEEKDKSIESVYINMNIYNKKSIIGNTRKLRTKNISLSGSDVLVSNNENKETEKQNYVLLNENSHNDNNNNGNLEIIGNMIPMIKYDRKWPKRIKVPEENPCFIKRETHRRYYVDAYYAPEISQRSINSKDETGIKYANDRNGSERYVNAFSVGLRGSVVFPIGVSLRSGINFSMIKERFEYIKERQTNIVIIRNPQNEPLDTITEEIIIPGHIYNKYKFIDIPITIGYEINLADFKFAINGGVGINVMTAHSGSVYSPDVMTLLSLSNGIEIGGKETDKSIYKNNVGLSILGSFGLNYKINDRFMLLAEPSIRYYIGSITESSYALTHKYMQVGLIAGIRYRIK